MGGKVPGPGDEIPELLKEPVSKVQLLRYAGASGDFNLIHTDVETARSVGLPGVIAHGMLSMGFLGQLLTGFAGPKGVRRLKVRFSRMVAPGDVIRCRGVVRESAREGSGFLLRLDVWAENPAGERVTEGEADVFLMG